MTVRRFCGYLLLVSTAALAVRTAYVLGAKRHEPLAGDQIYYSGEAVTLARGQGFRDPFIVSRTVPSADHPPLTSLVAMPATWLVGTGNSGDRIVLAQRLTMAVVGAVTVFAIGFAARAAIGPGRGERVGLLAACLAAVYPGLWINDGLVMSESIGALTIAVVILAAFAAVRRPGWRSMALLGASVGLACLARAEMILLAPLLVAPIALGRVGARTWAVRIRDLGAAALAVVVVLGPWVGANLVRFAEPTFLSTNDGLTLIGTNCPQAWSGPGEGLWSLQCIAAVDSDHDGIDDYTEFTRGTLAPPAGSDYSSVSAQYRTAALHYLRTHLGDFPGVVLSRELRIWQVRGVRQMIYYNTGEGREAWADWAAAVGFWILAPLSIGGALVLRHRGRPVWPLASQVVAAAVVAAAFYGLWRFRIGAEVAMVIGAAVLVDALLARSVPRWGSLTRGEAREWKD